MQESQTKTINLLDSEVKYWIYNPKATKTILMLHGFTGNHTGFSKIVEHITEYRLIVPDLPGFGESEPMKSTFTIENYANYVEELINKLNLDKPILFGHSFGSILAVVLATSKPEIVGDKLILVSSTATSPLAKLSVRNIGARIAELHYWLGATLPFGLKLLRSKTISRIITDSITVTKDEHLRQFITNHHFEDLEFIKPKIYLETYKNLNRSGIIDFASEITQKTLMIAGDKDPVWPIKDQREVAALIPNATLEELSGIGHLTHFEAPEEVARLINAFCEK